MDKIKIKTGEQLIAAQARFFAEFLEQYPIYKKLDLTDTQWDILWKELVKPLFDERFEYSFAALRQASRLKLDE